jgi:DNA-binding NarL/FixJ family response regulator
MSSSDNLKTARRVRVALLDDHELLLDSLSSWISANEPQFDLVLAVGTWVDLVRSSEFPTDLVLMDLQLKERVSIEARVRTCRAAGAVVVVLTALDTEEDRARALAAGASAYLTKAQPVREVMAVSRSVMGLGTVPVGDPVRERGTATTPVSARPRLSDSEVRALGFYVAGQTTVEVAGSMSVGYETAKTYLRRIREKYAKAGRPTSSRADLMRRAAEDGYLT